MTVTITEVTLRHDDVELARVSLPDGEYVIGRSRESHVFVNTPLISRQHARLIIADHSILIEDLGSSNGTYVADLLIAAPTPLAPGQDVRLGDMTLEIRRQSAPTDSTSTQSPRRDMIRRLLPEELLAGQRHTIGNVVAQGGMGAILDAEQTATKRNVAMKVMLETADDGDVLRFIEEAQVTAQLEHPNIVPVHELGVDDAGQLFYTMKMVRGITLKKVLELLRQGLEGTIRKYQLPALLTVFQKVCDAIAFAHSKGVIHRDLKPDNIMIGDFGEVLVMDWGLAKLIGQKDAPGPWQRGVVTSARATEVDCGDTMAGTIMGTAYYMAPEQARGEIDTLDARTDIYALGAILFELIYLRPPIAGDNLEDVLDHVRQGIIQWPNPRMTLRQKGRSHLPGGRAPDSLLAICHKALAADPAHRYARVDEFQADLEAYQHGFATSAEKTSPLRNFWLLLQRRKIESAAIAIVLLAVGGLGTKAFLAGREAEHALAHLKRNAPALLQLAETEALVQKFDSALEKTEAALQLDPQLHAARWRRAWIFLGLARWSEAAETLRDAAKRDAKKGFMANGILPVAEQLAAAPPPAGQAATAQELMVMRYLENVSAAGELTKFSSRFAADAEQRRRLVEQRLNQTLGKGAYSTALWGTTRWVAVTGLSRALSNLEPFRGLPLDGMALDGTRVSSLEPLRGMALHDLNISGTPVTSIEPLTGMPLATLRISNTKVADLTPLKGVPLSTLNADGCGSLTDLSALNGAPLRELRVGGTGVVELPDLSNAPLELFNAGGSKLISIEPLRGKPLREAYFGSTGVRDLRPLEGAPLTRLNLENSPCTDLTPIGDCQLEYLNISQFRGQDLAPLRGLPVKHLEIWAVKNVRDWAPLLDLPKLERIRCSKVPALLDVLRRHPTLRYIDCALDSNENAGIRTVDKFWQEYDAMPAGGGK